LYTKPLNEKVCPNFLLVVYNQFDRMGLGNLYSHDASKLPFKRIKHIRTGFQPTTDSCILIMVSGQLQVDDDPPMAFHQVFMLKTQNCVRASTNDVFWLGLHNILV
uniref:NTF2 domain-containing protein n=1 Tax=Amphiprion ocellaris TaxID=80972 RepID=A0A3Q1CGM2_AMPOC